MLLDHHIKDSLESKKYCIVAFIDLSGAFDRVWNIAVLQKLVNMGLKGRILGWLFSYLHGRSFRVFLEGEVSSLRNSSSGVPQGGLLSPLLFNILLSDIPKIDGVKYLEFADDIVVYASDVDPNQAVIKLEHALMTLHGWVEDWGQQINFNKTKAMYFTRKSLVPRQIRISTHCLEYVKDFKYLGLTFDSPKLTYKTHIQKITNSCTKSSSILKYLSSNHQGCDRETLLVVYKSLIRSKMDYASQIYQSAALTDLKSLDTVQNLCLRLCIGAWNTSPVTSLQVESHIPPLSLRRGLLISKLRYKIIEYPQSFPQSGLHLLPPPKNSFMKNSNSITIEWNLVTPTHSPCFKLSPIPPWCDTDIHGLLRTNLPEDLLTSINDHVKQTLFSELVNKQYANYTLFFTDGSKTKEKTGAAFVIPELRYEILCRIPSSLSIMSAELFAIKLALEFIKTNKIKEAVIFTDSLSSIMKLRNSRTLNDAKLIEILTLLHVLHQRGNIYLQWIPSHCGILGNEIADSAAKRSLSLSHITPVKNNYAENLIILKNKFIEAWQRHWDEQIQITQKGRALKAVKENIGYWPWSSHNNKRIEVALARLRIGHMGLNSVKHRFHLTQDPSCSCGQLETLEHFLLNCQLYDRGRNILKSELNRIDNELPFNTKTLLGGSNTPIQKQILIKDLLAKFLVSTGKLHDL